MAVLSLMILEVLLHILTAWGLSLRKSRIHLQREVIMPIGVCFSTSDCGMTELNAEVYELYSDTTVQMRKVTVKGS